MVRLGWTRRGLLLLTEAVDDAEVDAEIALEGATGGAGEGGADEGRENAESEVRVEVDVAGKVDNERWAGGVLPEAGLDVGETLGGSGEVADADATERFGTERVAQMPVEAVADAAGEGVLIDLRIRVLGVELIAERLAVTGL